ncbi:MAG TPA: NPCBM/NEW2 domain-containing protein [Pirellulales bacterium]|nr:NPCBM/NEW2 domain-containing protein [Pirellulales bacterium]
MSEPFDPYRKWLGIPPKDRPPKDGPNDQPPNHYRLLALELFEEDADAISNAADRQMAHVRTFQTGRHSAVSQKILNELSAARVCLLSKEKKAEYDAQLRKQLASQDVPAAPPVAPPVAPLPAPRPHVAPPPAARPILPTAAVIPLATPSVATADPADAPFATRTRRNKPPRPRGGGWQVPALVIAMLATLAAGAYYVVNELGHKPTVEAVAPNPGADVKTDPARGSAEEPEENENKDDAKRVPKSTPDLSPQPEPWPQGSASTSVANREPSHINEGRSIGSSAPGLASLPPPLLDGQVDLLGKIDVKRDAVAGDWKRDAEGLTSPAQGLARMRIPYAVPDQYVLTVEVERLSGDEAFGVGLAAPSAQTVAWLDGRGPFTTGLHGIVGSANGRKAPPRLSVGKSATLAYCVRRGGMVLLHPAGGDRGVSWTGLIDWKGDVASWRWPDGWGPPEKGRLELISSNSGFRIRRCLLMPVNDWKPDDGNVARIAKGMPPTGGSPSAVGSSVPTAEAPVTQNKKSPVPSGDTLDQAKRSFEEKFADDLQAAKAPDLRLSVARKILQAANEAGAGSAERYALLDQARELAASVGSSKVAFDAIDDLAQEFEIDELDLRLATLDEAAKAPFSQAAKREQFDSARELIEDCVDDDHFPEALRAATLAQAAARPLKDTALTRQIAEQKKDLDKLAKAFAQIKDDLERLAADANDPAANLAVGKFYCLVKDDWERGLPHLAAGGDVSLKDLAQRELAKPNGAFDQKSLGDAWWDLSRKERGPLKPALAGRAGFWYRRALPLLTGIEKEAVEKRLKEIGGSSRTDNTQFLSQLTERNVVVVNKWFAKGKNACVNKPLKVGGKESPHGLFTHPASNNFASVTYELGAKARRLSLDVALDDQGGNGKRTPLVFQVWGDGQRLWQSVPIAALGQLDHCDINVGKVKLLELRVNCPGRDAGAHAVWIEPKVKWK